jgi:hypothetical protein
MKVIKPGSQFITASSNHLNHLLYEGLDFFINSGSENIAETPSRNGRVFKSRTPVTVVYSNPSKRVLFNDARDANPFFHLFESMWMLSGRDDAEFVSHFSSNMKNYSDDGLTLNGAYGYRWRNHFDIDQLDLVIDRMRKDSKDRRIVLGMWDARYDLVDAATSKDVPCNLIANFDSTTDDTVDMMVSCRSNDFLWGTLGANCVHFPFLLEYVSTCASLKMGTYYQVSHNMHVYVDMHRTLLEKLGVDFSSQPFFDRKKFFASWGEDSWNNQEYSMSISMGEGLDFKNDFELSKELLDHDIKATSTLCGLNDFQPETDFGHRVLKPMAAAFILYKSDRLTEAKELLLEEEERSQVIVDWLADARSWLDRRIQSRKAAGKPY